MGVSGAWMSLVPGCPWCPHWCMGVSGASGVIGAWVSLVPSLVNGCLWCLDVFGAWVSLVLVPLVSLVPGCPWCLGVLGALLGEWVSLVLRAPPP